MRALDGSGPSSQGSLPDTETWQVSTNNCPETTSSKHQKQANYLPPMSVSEQLSPLDPPKPKKNGITGVLKQLLVFALAVVFLWLAFRNCDVNQLLEYSKNVDLTYIGVLIAVCILSHAIRAYRWLFILKPLTDRKISFWNSFCAVLLGNAVNVVIPRGGEVARLISICKSEKLEWPAVTATMFIDRLLDIALLVMILGGTMTILPKSISESMPWLLPGGGVLMFLTVAGLVMLPRMGKIMHWAIELEAVKKIVPAKIHGRLAGLAEQFDIGTKSLTDHTAYPIIAVLSVAMWVTYWLSTFLMIYAMRLGDTVSPLQSLIVFTVGSVGVLIPTPGSVGSFHFLVSQGLIMTAGVNKDLALAFATILHILSFVVSTCIPAAICIPIQTRTLNKQNS